MKNAPILFLHTGNPPFLNTAIQRLRLSNSNDIMLLGDESNSGIEGVSHYHITDYFESAKDFEENYYIHMSTNSYEFELICYQRWFIIQQFIEKNNIENFWYLDSDVIVYGNLDEYLKSTLPNKTFDLVGFDTKNCGGGDSFMPCFNFFSKKLINEITAFMLKSYVVDDILTQLKNKWNKHQTEKIEGGICDMTQLKLYFDMHYGELTIFNSYNVSNKLIPDGNFNSKLNYSKERIAYKTYLGRKFTYVKDYKAYGYLEDGSKVEFIATHFQSDAKAEMTRYAQRDYYPKNFDSYRRYILRQFNYQIIIPLKRKIKSLITK